MIKLRNKTGTKEIVFDNKAYALNEKDLGTAPAALNTFKGVGQVGEYLANTSIGNRKINIVGFILASTVNEMEVRKRDLFKIVNPLEEFDLIVGEYKLSCVSNDTMKFSKNHYENNSFLCKFQLSATALNPCFERLYSENVTIAYWQPQLKFPIVFTGNFIVGLRQPSLIARIQNDGDIEIGMKITFKATAALTNPYLTNITTGKTFKLLKELSAGEEIVVNTTYGNKSIESAGVNYFQFFDLDSEFIQLITGENILRYGADNNETNLEVSIEYVPKYLGV